MSSDDRELWERLGDHWEQTVLFRKGRGPCVPGDRRGIGVANAEDPDRGFAFRPDEIIVSPLPDLPEGDRAEVLERAADALDRIGIRALPDASLADFGVLRYQIERDEIEGDASERLEQLLRRVETPLREVGAQASPNHVFGGFQIRWWF